MKAEDWISVKDRLPDGTYDLLISLSDDTVLMGKLTGRYPAMWAAYWYNGHGPVDHKYTHREVTHWMPLPQPPKDHTER